MYNYRFYNNKNYFPVIPAYFSCTMHCTYHDESIPTNYLHKSSHCGHSASLSELTHGVFAGRDIMHRLLEYILTTIQLIAVLNTEIHAGQEVCEKACAIMQ